MLDTYNRKTWVRSLQQAALIAVLAGTAAGTAQAQALSYTTSTASKETTTFIDLSTVASSTVIPTANTDDDNSAAQPIGFTFSYNGTNFTQFTLNTNGFIKLGATPASAAAMFLDETPNSSVIDPFQSQADANIIAPFNIDLTAGAAGGTEYRVATTTVSGTTGARVCTIQWKNVQDKANVNPTQYTNMSFQVRLYETTNVIELVYGPTTAGTTSALRFSQVGLKGTSFSNQQIVQVIKQSGTAWSAATFADFSNVVNTQSLNTLNIRSIAPPTSGQTYRFAPAPSTDAAVSAIYTLGKIASPLALPHAVRAVVTNAGSGLLTNLDVTLNVTGANTFTNTMRVASLAVGASTIVTFASYPATLTLGTNTVTVTVPTDGNNTNNTATYGQLVTADRISYTDPSAPANGGIGLGDAILASKYTLAAATSISDVVLTFAPAGGTNVNTAPYQLVIYDASAAGGLPGTLLYTSPTQNRTTAGGAVTLAVPNVAVPTSFFIGVKEGSATNVALAYQTESPIRAGAFYYLPGGTATWLDFAPNNPFRFAIEFGTSVPNCAPPTALAVNSVTETSASVSFTAATGTSSYEIIYGPTGFNPGTSGTLITATASPVTLTGLSAATTYQVYVRSLCTGGGSSSYTAPASFTTQCAASQVITTFPYTQNFDTLVPGQSLPCGFSVLDANNDGTTWAVSATNPNSGANSIRYRGIALNNVAANDWFFTPALMLSASSRYQVAFRYRGEGIANTTSSFTESLEVKSGTAATVAAQTNLLYTNAAITNTSYALANGTSVPVVALLPAGASTQYVGFHVNSQANQGNLYIDDVSVTAVAVTATSEALLRAVSVFPNPSTTGVFDLEVHGANAKAALSVQVTNLLGQRVYMGAARDNYTNRLDLSSLAPGIYMLQVRNGEEYMTRQVSIVK